MDALVVSLFGLSVGVAAIATALAREYYRRKNQREPGLHISPYSAQPKAPAESDTPQEPAPAPAPTQPRASVTQASASARTAAAPRRFGGNYVRRAAPKRSVTTRRKAEDGPS